MDKFLKSYTTYPPGTIIVSKQYSLLQRLKYFLLRKRRQYNKIKILKDYSQIRISKWELLKDDYYLFLPRTPYNKKELVKLHTLLKSCQSTEDYLTALNIIRHGTVDVDKPLEQLKMNNGYKMVLLYQEPFQSIKEKWG